MRTLVELLLGVVVVVLLSEGLLRMLPVATGLAYQASNAQSPVVRGMPNHAYTYSIGWNMRMIRHGRLNNFGYPAATDYDPLKPNIVVIGDSYIESLMLDPRERLQSLLQEHLHDAIQVYGLGRSGSSLAQKLGVAHWAIPIFHPRLMVINLSEYDIAESLSAMSGDFYLAMAAGDCRLDRTDRLPTRALVRAVKETSLYHYLYDNLKIQATLGTIFQHPYEGKEEPDDGRLNSARQCFMRLIPQLIGLPPERVIFLVGADLGTIYRDQQPWPLDVYPLADLLERQGYAVVRSEPLLRQDYSRYHLPVSSRPTDDHWNARGQRLVAGALAQRVNLLLAQEAR
jgi:hypothetical protein